MAGRCGRGGNRAGGGRSDQLRRGPVRNDVGRGVGQLRVRRLLLVGAAERDRHRHQPCRPDGRGIDHGHVDDDRCHQRDHRRRLCLRNGQEQQRPPCVGPPNCLGFGGSNDNGDGNSLTVVNISSPTAPSVVGTVQSNSTTTPFPDSLFGAYAVAVSGNYAFVASQGLLSGQPTAPDSMENTNTVIDLTTPSSPTIVASIDNSALSGGLANGLDHATGVAISGQYAYVT